MTEEQVKFLEELASMLMLHSHSHRPLTGDVLGTAIYRALRKTAEK